MSNYRRLISYIYAYEGGIKGKNVGFAKLEVRNGQCKIQVNVRNVYIGSQDTGVYLLSGGDEILVGKIFIRNGAGEFRAVVSVNNVAGSGQTIDQCYGLTVHNLADSWQSYTTIWEDAVAHAAEVALEEATSEQIEKKEMEEVPKSQITAARLEHVVENHKNSLPETIEAEIEAQDRQPGAELEAMEIKLMDAVAPIWSDGKNQEKLPPNTEKTPKAEVPGPGVLPLSEPKQEISHQGEGKTEVMRPGGSKPEIAQPGEPKPEVVQPGESKPEIVQPAEPKPEEPMPEVVQPAEPKTELSRPKGAKPEVPQPETGQLGRGPELQPVHSELERIEEEPKIDMIWQQFFKRYPKIQAFDYNGGCEILTIKPQDIGLLPRETWAYGNNSFLLHGYYNHRYLIFARLNNPKGEPRYLLGVPGHYYSNEKYMAAMFGFPNFVLSKIQPAGDGRFGYWYTDVRMNS